MLNHLSVKNFALIEDTHLEFSEGLNVLTGETGAGKTLLVEALGLALGDKAGAHQVRKGAPRLTVVAGFSVSSAKLKVLLRELDMEADGEELLLRREVDASGRSRGFVNDSPVNLSTLSRLGERLVYMHGQHDHQLLLKPSEQRDLLDDFGRLAAEREAVSQAYGNWRDLFSEQEAMSLSEQERAQRIDLYRFQVQELRAAQPKPDEDEALERLLPQLKNGERLKNLSQEAYGLLYGEEGSALDKIRKVQRHLEGLQNLGADLSGTVELVQEAVIRLEEAARGLEDFGSKVDPQRLDEVLGRLDLLGKLKRIYGPTLADVLAHQKKAEEDLCRLENTEERTRDLSRKLAEAEARLKACSENLTRARQAAAKKLSAAVEKEFREVGLPHALFSAAVEKNGDGAYGAAGWDQVTFLFTPNPGEGRQPLAEVASGGELSRVMLALATVLARTDAVPTLVFDEIDAGVGGTLGAAVGKKLARLGTHHQVLCITHLATIAACARSHFRVEKDVKKDRTRTLLKRLSEEERVTEIARMFGSADAGEGSISVRHARELLESSKS